MADSGEVVVCRSSRTAEQGRLTASVYANLSVLREGARVAGYLSCPRYTHRVRL
jgi:hypothetical protein